MNIEAGFNIKYISKIGFHNLEGGISIPINTEYFVTGKHYYHGSLTTVTIKKISESKSITISSELFRKIFKKSDLKKNTGDLSETTILKLIEYTYNRTINWTTDSNKGYKCFYNVKKGMEMFFYINKNSKSLSCIIDKIGSDIVRISTSDENVEHLKDLVESILNKKEIKSNLIEFIKPPIIRYIDDLIDKLKNDRVLYQEVKYIRDIIYNVKDIITIYKLYQECLDIEKSKEDGSITKTINSR